jgi:C4-dicarboxylate-specific signal transduction histidine kinase
LDSRLDFIRESCQSIYERLDELQRNSNRATLNHSLHLLRDALKGAIKRASRRANGTGVEMRLSNDLGLVVVLCDSHCMDEVFPNILANAIEAPKAVHRQGELVEIRTSLSGKWIAVSFMDNGPGFSEEMLGKAFEPFASTKPKRLNWGMGLSFCGRIANKHCGRVVPLVYDPVQEGAFNLPFQRA